MLYFREASLEKANVFWENVAESRSRIAPFSERARRQARGLT
jgi:hypothetical protein